jgi:hypothetical protein
MSQPQDLGTATPSDVPADPHGPQPSLPPRTLDRREAIRRVSLLLGGAGLVGGSGLLAGCEGAQRPAPGSREPIGEFTAEDIALLDEVAETLLPETATPGAKAAGVGPFMALMVTDTYQADEQDRFRVGMGLLEEAARQEHGAGFTQLTPESRLALLERLDREQVAHEEARGVDVPTDAPAHYFRMMKELALLGYFTSEIGCTVAQRYVEAPGRYEPCVPYTPGEPSWAPHA